MKCASCQTENPDTRKFCRECGSKLLLICPECSTENLSGDKFCGECGHSLLEPAEPPSIDYSQPQSYTPKFLADKILTTRSSIEGERKLVTVLFADVANYTSISEKLDPEEVHQIMDGCFKILMEEIHKYEGTINQFTGDGVMALFGAPVAHEDHAQRACHASLSIQRAIGEYGEKVKRDTGIDLKLRIGLNSGPVIVGSIGDDLRMDYTAIGDTTNLASRMESMARPGTVFVSQNTHRLARDFFEFEFLGKLEVKGKEEPVETYKLIKTSEVVTRIEAATAKGLTRFVGRKNSMAALMEPYEKAQSGSGQVVGMVGEAGVGKSRLLLEFRNRLPQDEFTYIEGRCLHYGGTMPYLPILDIIKMYFEIKEGDREFVIRKKMEERVLRLDENFKGVLPSFQDLLSLKVEDGEYLNLQPKQKRERAFEAIRDLLIRESRENPLIVAVEDFHWIDKTSEEFLTYLIDWLANARILLILLYRPEYSHRWESKSYYNRIGLTHLTTQSSAELVQAILEGAEIVPELRELILTRTSGNPLFMEELTHTLLENGTIQRKDDQYILSRKGSEIRVPDTIQGIIAARMDRLEENLKRIMQVASVIGREFAFRILQSITDVRQELKSYLLNLQGLEFIYEKQLFPELEYIFKHALTQEVAYNSLLQKRRKQIHEKIGKAIEQLYPEKLEEFYETLAYHYSTSDNAGKACQYLILCGDKATINYSNWEAFHFYKKAIDILNKMSQSEENKRRKIEVYLLMATCMIALGYPKGSFQMLQAGERLSKELGDEKSHATFCSRMGTYCTNRGNHLEGIRYAEDAFDQARRTQDIELLARVAINLCFSYMAAGRYYRIMDVAPDVLDLIQKAKRESDFLFSRPVNLYAVLSAFCGHAMGLLGNFEEGRAFFEKGLGAAAEDDLRTLGFCEWHYGHLLNAKGHWRLAISHFEKCIEYLEEAEWFLLLGLAWAGLGLGYQHLGDYETARRHIEKSITIQKDKGIEWWASTHYWYLSLSHFALGDLRNAGNFVEQALKLSQRNNEKHIEGATRILMGRVLGKREPSHTEKAEECILQGIKILDDLKIKPWSTQGYLSLGQLYADTGQREKALINLEKAEAMFQETGMDYWLARTYAVYADLHKKEGDQSKAKEQLEKAIGILRDLSADGWVKKYEAELALL